MKSDRNRCLTRAGGSWKTYENVIGSCVVAFALLAVTVLAAPLCQAGVEAGPAAQGETIQITAGKTAARRYARNPQREIRGARLISAASGKPVPHQWAEVSVATRPRDVEIAIATTTAIPPGDYRLQLLDAGRRSLAGNGYPAMVTVRVSQAGPARAAAPPDLGRTPPPAHTTTRTREGASGQGQARVTDNQGSADTTTATQRSRMRDAIRGEGGVSARLGQIGGASRVGGQLLFGFGQTMRDTITAQLGAWPAGDWHGVLGADISTLRDRSAGGYAKTPTRPDKSTGDITRGFRPDARLMTGDGEGDDSGGGDGSDKGDGSDDGSGKDKTDGASDGSDKDKKDGDDDDRVDNITTNDSDTDNSDGSSTQSSDVTNTSSDGSTFRHTVSSTRDKNGNRTDTQSVDYKDSAGNQTSYRSVTSGGKTTTRCSGHLCTPHPDSAECAGPGCDTFNRFVQGFVHLAVTYGIRSKQRDRESAMQPDGPGSGKRRAGSERPSSRDVIKQRTSPYILPADDSGTSQGTGASGGGARPHHDPDTLVNPPEPGKGSGTPGNPAGK